MKRTFDIGAPAPQPGPTADGGREDATTVATAPGATAGVGGGANAGSTTDFVLGAKAGSTSEVGAAAGKGLPPAMAALIARIDAPDAQMQRLFAEVIAPSAERIGQIGMRGEVVVAVHAPEGELAELAKFVGWTGAQAVFRMSNAKRKVFADNIERTGDAGLARWLRRADVRGNFRLFAISGGASLCLNFRKNVGWSIEPS